MEYDWRNYFKQKASAAERNRIYPITSTVPALAWVFFSICALTLLFMVLWAFFGHIPVTVTGRGLIVTESGLDELHAPLSGTVKNLPVKVGDHVKKGDLLVEMSDPQGNIYSLSDGQILEVLVSREAYVKEGAPAIWMENFSSADNKGNFLIYGYFPVESGKRLKVNAPVEMTLTAVNSNKYGTLLGTVKSISLFAVSKENMLSEIQNPSLVDFLSHQAPAVIKVLVQPKYVPDTDPPKFVWSSGLEPEEPLTTGTLVTLEATVEKIRPIYYLLPVSQFKSSSEDLDGT